MKKFEYPPELNFRFKIQAPSGKHKTFRLFKVHRDPSHDGPRTETVEDPALESVNASLRSGSLTKEAARKEVDLLVERLYREAGVRKFKVVSNSDNQQVLQRFWEDYYADRRLVDRDSTYAKYRRAVEAVGELSLRTASQRELQRAIDSKYRGNKQRSVVNRLHTILQWLKRGDVSLVLEPEEEGEVRYLTRTELEAVLAHVEDPVFRLACRVARGTGARIGELLAMRAEHAARDGKTVFIKHQVRRDGVTALAKSKKASSPGRTVYVLPEARKLVAEWVREKGKFTREMRLSAANILRDAAKRAFPSTSEKWVKFHDLRHSYAIELCQSGVSLLQIAQQLGNSERVCQRHYTGFMATLETIDLIEAKVRVAEKLRRAD